MARAFVPKVITANHLLEGDVIYFTADGSWSRKHEDAVLYQEKSDAEEALAEAAKQVDVIVGAYLADAVLGEDGKPQPVHFREAFRTRGPSNYPDHGKQAEG